ncbi:hypothetical protein GBA52_027051 [Prunus armeniaca]|nr:hypothetical protein GBA52_027051 [Prunus armeniaca]
MVAILRKAKGIKARLESLDRMWLIEMYISYKEGSPVDRMRIWVTTGLRIKLRDMMNDFQSLREQIVQVHK